MAEVLLHAAGPKAATRVSNVFIDSYMKRANGEYVKVYLYLLRCLGDSRMEFSISGMADALDHTQRDISRALRYWEKEGLLGLEFGENGNLSGICVVEPTEAKVSLREDRLISSRDEREIPARMDRRISPQEDKVVSIEERRRNAARAGFSADAGFSAEEMAALGQNQDVREMLCVTETYMGRPLSPTESDTVLFWYDRMGLSSDLIVYLVEYCLERGHKSIPYMNRVAVNWAERGISTVEEAKESAASFESRSSVVAVEFGISDRGLTPTERGFLEKWQSQYGFSQELIREACRRTILKTGRPSFQYADTILKSWQKEGAYSLEKIRTLDEEHKQQAAQTKKTKKSASQTKKGDRFHNFSEHGYDYGMIQNLLIQQQ